VFENYTYEAILKNMLNKISDDLDKREGSIIYDALAPAALELARIYSDMDRFLSYTFVDDSSPIEYIRKRAAEFGITLKEATYAIKKASFYNSKNELMDVPIGARFSIDSLNYKAIEKISTGTYKLQCEASGTKGNSAIGALIPIEYIKDLAKATINELLIAGEDTESKQSLYSRFVEKIRNPSTSGNKHHYLFWAKEVGGVGDAKVIPMWNGPGTVKIVIVDSDKQPATSALIDEVFNHIEEMRPINVAVTVVSAISKDISITGKIKISSSVTLKQVEDSFSNLLAEYLKAVAFNQYTVSYARIGSILMSVPGVIDYEDLKLNGLTSNLELKDEEVPNLDNIDLGVY
jgi:uncharacterized phage protein gp47/JayE